MDEYQRLWHAVLVRTIKDALGYTDPETVPCGNRKRASKHEQAQALHFIYTDAFDRLVDMTDTGRDADEIRNLIERRIYA
jgi:hypothetical protein